MKFRRIFGVVSLVFALSGCQLFSRPKPLDLSGYRPVSMASTALVLDALSQASSAVSSFKTLAQVRIVQDLGAERVKQTIVFRYPMDMRVDLYEPNINHRIGLVIVHDGIIQSLDLERKEVLTGTANVQNLQQLLSVPLELSEVMMWLAGRVEIPVELSARAVELYQAESNPAVYLLRYQSGDGRSIVCRIIDADLKGHLRITSVEIRRAKDDDLLFKTDYTYEETLIRDMELPKELRMEFPRDNTIVTISYDRPVLNPDLSKLPPTFFEFPQLNDFKAINLDEIEERSIKKR